MVMEMNVHTLCYLFGCLVLGFIVSWFVKHFNAIVRAVKSFFSWVCQIVKKSCRSIKIRYIEYRSLIQNSSSCSLVWWWCKLFFWIDVVLLILWILYELKIFSCEFGFVPDSIREILKHFAQNMLPNLITEIGSILFTLLVLNLAYTKREKEIKEKQDAQQELLNEQNNARKQNQRIKMEEGLLMTWVRGGAFEFSIDFLDHFLDWEKENKYGIALVNVPTMELKVQKEEIEELSDKQLKCLQGFLDKNRCWLNFRFIYRIMCDNITMFEREIPDEARSCCLNVTDHIANVLHEHFCRSWDRCIAMHFLSTMAEIVHWPYDFGMSVGFTNGQIQALIKKSYGEAAVNSQDVA